MKTYINTILNVPVSDPDDARRRRLLNILLFGTIVATLLGLVAVIIDTLTRGPADRVESQSTLFGIVLATTGMLFIYQINRRYSGRLAAFLFLILLIAVFSLTDTPEELTGGRSLFLFTIPIAMSSLILAPAASFLVAALSSGVISALALSIGHSINLF